VSQELSGEITENNPSNEEVTEHDSAIATCAKSSLEKYYLGRFVLSTKF
jgi:hypothetical protein